MTDEPRRPRRNLPIPVHRGGLVRRESIRRDGPHEDDEVLDGEIIDDETTSEDDTEEIIDAEVEPEPDTVPMPVVDPMTWEERLRRDMTRHANIYLDSVRRTDMRSIRRQADLESRMNDLQGKHKAYASMMILSTLIPLRHGVNINAVAESVGMGVTMWMVSPNFRKQVGSFARDARMALEDMADNRRKNKNAEVKNTVEARAREGKSLPPSMRRRLERIEYEERGGRVPFNEHSAALTYIGLNEAAFMQMREDGADVEAIQKNHKALMSRFWSDVQRDGLDARHVEATSRLVTGQRIRTEPQLANVFVETAHGEIDMVTEDGRWNGQWSGRLDEPVTGGVFTVRPPYDEPQHEMMISTVIQREMERSARAGDIQKLNETMLAYAAGWGLRQNNIDTSHLTGELGERSRRARSMLVSMELDGLSRTEQQNIYADGFVRAMDTVAKEHPEIETHWAQQYGSNWRAEMRSLTATPEETIARWQRGDFYSKQNEGETYGQPSTDEQRRRNWRTYNRARDNQEYNAQRTHGLGADDFELNDDTSDGFQMGGDGYDDDEPEPSM